MKSHMNTGYLVPSSFKEDFESATFNEIFVIHLSTGIYITVKIALETLDHGKVVIIFAFF